MKVVYLSGPIRGKNGCNQFENVHKAILAARKLRDAGYCVIVPQRSALDEIVCGDMGGERWLQDNFEFIRRSDLICRIPGDSSGSDKEIDFARTIGKPIFLGAEAVLEHDECQLGFDFCARERRNEGHGR